MAERKKPQVTTVTLNVDPGINRQSLVTFTLGAVERDSQLMRRLGQKREAFDG